MKNFRPFFVPSAPVIDNMLKKKRTTICDSFIFYNCSNIFKIMIPFRTAKNSTLLQELELLSIQFEH